MCLSTSSFEPFIPSFQPRQQHSLLGSAISPILEGFSVCSQTKAGGLSFSQKGSWFTLVHFLRMYSLSQRTYPRIRYMEKVPRMDVTSLTNLYHLLYSGLILQNFLPTQGGGSSRHRLLEEKIFSPNFGAASSSLPLQN